MEHGRADHRAFDGAVVAHRRGHEAELCSTALLWISDIEHEKPTIP